MTKYDELRNRVEVVHSAIRNIDDIVHELTDALSRSDPNEALRKITATAEATAPYVKQLREVGVDASVASFMNEVTKIEKAFEEERDRLQQLAFQKLAERGWYLTWDMYYSDLERIIEFIALDDVSSIEQLVISFVRDSIESMLQTITRAFPDRELIVNDAFAAHAEGRYALSIPALLAQSDWMSREAIKASIFSTKDGKPATATKFEHRQGKLDAKKKSDPWHLEKRLRALRVKEFNSMRYITPFQKSSKVGRLHDSALVPAPISRHATLHGDDPNYASEISSLRCILLASFLARAKEAFLSIDEEETAEEKIEREKSKGSKKGKGKKGR